nr:MAG TPA: hypothetical protein [Caudoviricetes sp.]
MEGICYGVSYSHLVLLVVLLLEKVFFQLIVYRKSYKI